MLLPALNSALQKGKIIQCTSNQKFIALALNMYAADYKEFYPSSAWDGTQSWRIWNRALLMGRYIGKPFKDATQISRADRRDTVLICPEDSNPRATNNTSTDYRSYGLNASIATTPASASSYGPHYIPRHHLNIGRGCGRNNCPTGGTISKGPQDIVLTGDSRSAMVKWWASEKINHLNITGDNTAVAEIYPFHTVGVPLSFVDGHVRFIRYPFAYQKLNFENSLNF